MTTNILEDFQICISVPLTSENLEHFSYTILTKGLYIKPISKQGILWAVHKKKLREYWQCKNYQAIYFSFSL